MPHTPRNYLLCILLIKISYENISLLSQQYPNANNLAFYSLQATSTHVIGVVGQVKKDLTFTFYSALNLSSSINLTVTGLPLDQPAQLRTAQFNSYYNISAVSLLYFNTTSILYFPAFTIYRQQIFNTQSMLPMVIKQACFGAVKQHVYVLVLNTTSNLYSILFINNTGLINHYTLDINSTNAVDEFKFDNNRLILLFSTTLIVYDCVDLVLGERILAVSYPPHQIGYMDVKIYNEVLVYSIGTSLQVFNLTSLTRVLNYTVSYPIQSITKITSFILIKTTSIIYQYDYEINAIVSSFLITYRFSALQRIFALENNKIVGFGDYKNYYTFNFQVLEFTMSYSCVGCASCLASYYLNGSECLKNTSTANSSAINSTAFINSTINTINNNSNNTFNNITSNNTFNNTFNNPFNITSNNTISNSFNKTSNGISNNTNLTGISNISDASTTAAIVHESSEVQSSGYTETAGSVLQLFIGKGFAYIFSFSTFRLMPKFFLVLTVIINDLAFYKFHRKFEPKYPNSTLLFMQKFDLMKQLGVNSFSSYIPFLNKTQGTLFTSNDHFLKELKFTDHDPQQPYFLYSISGFFKNNIFTSICYYFIFKLLHYLLYSMRGMNFVFEKCYKYIKMQTRWWTLIVAIIEMNIADLIFASALQSLKLSSSFFQDKLNLSLTYLVFFVAVFYSLSFYSIIFAKENKEYSKNLVIYTNQQTKSYFFQPSIFLVRSITKCFTHGYFIYSYSMQIVILFGLDFPFLIICLCMRKIFRNRFIFFLITLYFLGFLLFDLYFVLEYHSSLTSGLDRQLIGFIFCCSLAGISLLLCVVFFISELFEACKIIKKTFFNNQVRYFGQKKKCMNINYCKKQVQIKTNNLVLNSIHNQQNLHQNELSKKNAYFSKTEKKIANKKKTKINRKFKQVLTQKINIEKINKKKDQKQEMQDRTRLKIKLYKKQKIQGQNRL